MSELTLWMDQEVRKLRRDIDRLFERQWFDLRADRFVDEAARWPTIKISETKDAIMVKAIVPGIGSEDLEISFHNDTLIIRGKKSGVHVGEDTYRHRIERRFESFSRSVRLPCRVKIEEIKATYKNGILEIVMPKWEPEKSRGIKVEFK